MMLRIVPGQCKHLIYVADVDLNNLNVTDSKGFQPKIPTRKGKFELHCSLKKPKVVFPSICPNIGTNISNSLLSKKKHFCSPSLCKYLGYK